MQIASDVLIMMGSEDAPLLIPDVFLAMGRTLEQAASAPLWLPSPLPWGRSAGSSEEMIQILLLTSIFSFFHLLPMVDSN